MCCVLDQHTLGSGARAPDLLWLQVLGQEKSQLHKGLVLVPLVVAAVHSHVLRQTDLIPSLRPDARQSSLHTLITLLLSEAAFQAGKSLTPETDRVRLYSLLQHFAGPNIHVT